MYVTLEEKMPLLQLQGVQNNQGNSVGFIQIDTNVNFSDDTVSNASCQTIIPSVFSAGNLNAFLDLNTAQKNAAETKTNQWRTILFTLCRTPEWQAL